MNTTEVQAVMRPVLDRIKAESFVQADGVSDAEAMGLVVSKFFEWDGIEALKVAEAALEDSNFHTAGGRVAEIREREEKDFA